MKHRFEVLDIFRGIFASLVVLFHLRGFSDSPIINNPFIDSADVFVDFFFVLSGFVITYSNENLNETSGLKKFLKKRFLRIYPLHFIMLIAFVVVETSKSFLAGYIHINQPNLPDNNIYSFFTNLFLLNSVKLFGINDFTWNIPSWSISAEVISYIVFGVGILLVNKTGFKNLRIIFFICVAIAASLMVFAFTGKFEYMYGFDYGFLRGLIGFFTGSVCFVVFKNIREKLYGIHTSVYHVLEILLIVLIPTMVYYGEWVKQYVFLFNALFFISIMVFSTERGIVSTLLKKSDLLKKTGSYSYSIYMTHVLILSIFNIVFMRLLKFPPTAYNYLVFVNYFIIYKVSQWTYHHIEMRFNQPKVEGELLQVKKGFLPNFLMKK